MKSTRSVYTFAGRMGMKMRLAPLFLAAAVLGALALGGCTGSAKDSSGGTTTDVPEQNGLAVGTKAPDFRMKNQNQETVALSDYAGTKNVILVFYPADFTPV